MMVFDGDPTLGGLTILEVTNGVGKGRVRPLGLIIPPGTLPEGIGDEVAPMKPPMVLAGTGDVGRPIGTMGRATRDPLETLSPEE